MMFVPTFQATSKLINEERERKGLQQGGCSPHNPGEKDGRHDHPFFLADELGSSFSTAWHKKRP
jgi:hypothetical protein